MSKKTILNLDYALMQGAYWMYYVVAGIYVSVYMLGKGYTNTSIGLVIAIGNILAVLLQGIVANIADRNERVTDITVIRIMLVVLFALTAGVLLIGRQSIALTIVYTALIVVHTGLHPFVNALSFMLEESGEHVSFGIGRSAGSFTAAVLGYAMGYWVADFGVDIIPFSGVIVLIGMEVVTVVTGRHYRRMCAGAGMSARNERTAVGDVRFDAEDVRPDAGDDAVVSDISAEDDAAVSAEDARPVSFADFVGGNARFMLLSAGVIGLFFGNVIVENFTYQIVEGIGGNTEQMGTVIFVMAVLEMPAMLGFDRLRRRFSYVFLIRTAAVFFTIKILLIYLADSMLLLYVAQLGQVLGYGLMFPAMVGFIDDIMSKGEAARGQAVFTAAITIGNVIGCVCGGRILDVASVKALLFIGTVATAAGAALMCGMIGRIKSEVIRGKI